MRRSQEPTDTESLAAADEVATAAQVGTAYWGQGKARGGIRSVKIRYAPLVRIEGWWIHYRGQ
jgi:hypothetical protein